MLRPYLHPSGPKGKLEFLFQTKSGHDPHATRPPPPNRFERRARRGAACCAPTSTQAVQKASSNFSFKRKAGTILTQRARHLLRVWFFLYFFYFLYVLYICFFGLDSGGTNPDTR